MLLICGWSVLLMRWSLLMFFLNCFTILPYFSIIVFVYRLHYSAHLRLVCVLLMRWSGTREGQSGSSHYTDLPTSFKSQPWSSPSSASSASAIWSWYYHQCHIHHQHHWDLFCCWYFCFCLEVACLLTLNAPLVSIQRVLNASHIRRLNLPPYILFMLFL